MHRKDPDHYGMPWDRMVTARDYRDTLNRLEGGVEVPDDFRCNGCTFVPDRYFRGTDTTPAGIIHDFRFREGGGEAEFRHANSEFYRNLRTLGFPRTFSWMRWLAVSTVGRWHFNWKR